MDRKLHWEQAWAARPAHELSWYQETPEPSLGLVTRVVGDLHAPIVDIGGGASALADGLARAGYDDLTVLDVSGAALEALTQRMPERGRLIRTIEADLLDYPFAEARFAAWHDRAVFHFLTAAGDRERYRHQMASAVRPGGHAIVGTFAQDGPERCSGLPVQRYDAASLADALGPNWTFVQSLRHEHRTPAGKLQAFTFVVARRGD